MWTFLFMELNSELFFTLDGDGGRTHWALAEIMVWSPSDYFEGFVTFH